MPRVPEPDDTPGDDTPENSEKFMITRRDALIGAATAGVMNAFGVGTAAAVSDPAIDLNINQADGKEIHRQYADGTLESFELSNDGGPIMVYNYDEMQDDYIVGEITFSMDDEPPVTIGNYVDHNVKQNGGTVTFTQRELWGENNPFDFADVDFIDDNYENLNIDIPEPGDSLEKPLVNTHEFTLRFRITSSHGSISEEKTVNFSLSMGVPLGFGQHFGVNFGKDHVESWPEDWRSS